MAHQSGSGPPVFVEKLEFMFSAPVVTLFEEHSAFWLPDATMTPLWEPVNPELDLKSHHTRNKSKNFLFFVFLLISTVPIYRILPFKMNTQQGSSTPNYITQYAYRYHRLPSNLIRFLLNTNAHRGCSLS